LPGLCGHASTAAGRTTHFIPARSSVPILVLCKTPTPSAKLVPDSGAA
jgi:hypothetical protein